MNDYDLKFDLEQYDAEIATEEYLVQYRNTDYFCALCKQCQNYGKQYSCPPILTNYFPDIQRFNTLQVIGWKLFPRSQDIPLRLALDFLAPAISLLTESLLSSERRLDGFACSFSGQCVLCGEMPCARLYDEPCRHPQHVRPSFEALGFDVSKTAKDLLGIEILWSKNEFLPTYLTLVCGVFYNKKKKI